MFSFLFSKWTTHQLYGNMFLEIYGSVWQLDHCLPIASFNLINENDMKKCFNWINLRPMYSNEENSKKAKINHYLYLYQDVKLKFFSKQLTKSDLIKIFIDEIYSKPPTRKYPTMRIIQNHIDEIWSTDLADFSDYKSSIS